MAEKLWLKNYPVSWNLEYPEISLYDLIKETSEKYPDLTALVFMGQETTFREMQKNIDSTAAALVDLGVKKGDRVALMLPNCPQYVFAYYACMKLGAVVVQVNPLYSPGEVEFILNDSGATVFFGVDAAFESFQAVRDRVPVQKVIVVRILWMEVEGENLFFDELLQKYPPDSPQEKINPKEDVAVFQYTGGTTGFPKAVMLSHFNITSNVTQIKEWVSEWREEKFGSEVTQQYVVGIMPFFHSYGMTALMITGLTMPIGLLLIPRFDVDVLLSLIKEYKPILFPGVPTIYTAIVNHPEADKYNIDAVEVCISAAAPMPVDMMQRFEKITGSKMLEGYGLSEAAPATHSNPFIGKRKPGSIGMPYPDTDCKIVDMETGTKEMPVGESGELIIKGPQVMLGYWNQPEETAHTLREGWLYTGDIAQMDEDGYFYIVDRKKEMILTGGYNVYPREVDEVLFAHPKVAEAISAGIPDDYYGEVLKGFVVLKEGETATESEILDFCKERLARYKVPRSIEFRSELPKSAIGKLLRRVLVEEELQKLKKKNEQG